MSAKDIHFSRPKDWQKFERLCADLFAEIWRCPSTQMNGRSGQPQAGVDVYGRQNGRWIGVQCKGRDGDFAKHLPLTAKDLAAEVEKAKQFRPHLKSFILATTASNSQEIQAAARELTEKNTKANLFSVDVYGWEEIERRLASHLQVAREHGLLETLTSDILAHPDGTIRNYTARERAGGIRKYRKASLLHNDIIDLAELGGLDPELVRESLAIRQLYVPLRCYKGKSKATAAAIFAQFRTLRGDELEGERNQTQTRKQTYSIGDQLKETNRLVVLADPGAGKTTLTRWITTAYLLREAKDPSAKLVPDIHTLPRKAWLPILIACRSLDRDVIGKSFRHILYNSLQKMEFRPEEIGAIFCGLWDVIDKEAALVIFDGLDEIIDLQQREKFVEQIRVFAENNKQLSIIATSRIYGYEELGAGLYTQFQHVMLAPLRKEEKELFASSWCKLTESPEKVIAATAKLVAAIHASDRVEKMSSNPLMLTTLALVLRKHGDIPERRVKLYEEAVDLLLRWRSQSDLRIDSKEALPQLAYLAYAMTSAGAQRFREDQVLSLWDDMRTSLPRYQRRINEHTSDEFLKLVERRSAILINVGSGLHHGELRPLYEFRHLCFQDYLTARALGMGCYPGSKEGDLSSKLSELAGATTRNEQDPRAATRWAEPLRLCVSALDDMGSPTEPNIRAILTPAAGEVVAQTSLQRAVLSAQVLSDEPDISEEFAFIVAHN